jgi:hypothetical protein
MVRPLQKQPNMRCFSLLAASIALLVPALASAQPALTESAPAPAVSVPSEPATYVQVEGFAGGVLFGDAHDGFAVEAGHHVQGPVWIHGMVGGGEAQICNGTGFFDPCDRGSYWTGRAGVELRGTLAGTRGVIGGFVGGDVGVRNYSTGMELTSNASGLALGRVGFDIGSSHIRERTWIGLGSDGIEGSAGLAYQW